MCSVSLKRTNVGGGTPSSPSSAQSWLVDAYRHCNATKINTRGPAFPSDVVCPNATAVAAFNEAVRRGDITYHAFPFNAEPELFTPELFDAALNLTFAQDAFYGHPKRRTLSQRVSRSWRRWGGSCVNVCVCVCVCVCVGMSGCGTTSATCVHTLRPQHLTPLVRWSSCALLPTLTMTVLT